jgi:hypothetical protein
MLENLTGDKNGEERQTSDKHGDDRRSDPTSDILTAVLGELEL